MKLLFDQNISIRVLSLVIGLYPARKNDFIIVSKDSDFHQKSFLMGFPPKVIWLRIGNCTTQDLPVASFLAIS